MRQRLSRQSHRRTGAVATELPEQTTDPEKRKQLDDYRAAVRFLEPDDIGDAILYAAMAPVYVNVAELFMLPTEQT